MKKLGVVIFALAGLGLVGCGGNSSVAGNNNNPPPPSAPAVVSVQDAPMDGVVSAEVTISAVNLSGTLAGGGAANVSLLTKPRTVELSELGGVRAPLELGNLQEGTYNSVSVTVSAAEITYLDPVSGLPVEAQAALGNNGTATFTLNPALAVNSTAAVDLHLDFNLPQSFDLTSGKVTFTPVIRAAAASVDKESEDDRDFRVVGQVTATTSNSITVQTLTSKLPLTFTVDSNTEFDDGATLAGIQTGAVVIIKATLDSKGNFVANDIDPVEAGEKEGGSFNDTGAGTVTAVTDDSTGNLVSFQMVTRGRFFADGIGRTLTVNVNASTVYRLPIQAQNAGANTFDASQIFPGQTVMVAGLDVDAQAGTLTAAEIRLFPGFHHGLLSSAVSGTAPNFTFSMQLNPLGTFALLSKAATLNVSTSAATHFGDDMSGSQLTGLAVGTALRVRGYILVSNGVYTDYAVHIDLVENND